MNKIVIATLGTLLAAMLSYGQNSSSSPAPAAASAHGAFPVKVVKTLDSSKLKEGDAVEVETAGSFKLPDGSLVPKGSKLTGHVAAAKARSKGDAESQLTLSFDKLNVSNGKQLSVRGTVQAVLPPQDQPEPLMAGKASGAAGGSYGGTSNVSAVDAKPGSNTDSSTKPQMGVDPKATGVQGIHGLELNDGALSSKGKNVKLGDGVRMIVKIDILG